MREINKQLRELSELVAMARVSATDGADARKMWEKLAPIAAKVIALESALSVRLQAQEMWESAARRAGFSEGGNEHEHGWIDEQGDIHRTAEAACKANGVKPTAFDARPAQ